MDNVSSDVRSRTMRAVKSKNTQLELKFRKALWAGGVRGWRLHDRSLPGNPDIVFSRARVLVLLDSCFWHGCRHHLRRPKSNVDYWSAKIANNVSRDKIIRRQLRAAGWTVLSFWQHEIEANLDRCVSDVKRSLISGQKPKIEVAFEKRKG
jgi:DNA mismatch endonuclease, patch repair protein